MLKPKALEFDEKPPRGPSLREAAATSAATPKNFVELDIIARPDRKGC